MKLSIVKMKCSGCVDIIARVLSGLDPIIKPEFDLEHHVVAFDTTVDQSVILSALAAAGYPAVHA